MNDALVLHVLECLARLSGHCLHHFRLHLLRHQILVQVHPKLFEYYYHVLSEFKIINELHYFVLPFAIVYFFFLQFLQNSYFYKSIVNIKLFVFGNFNCNSFWRFRFAVKTFEDLSECAMINLSLHNISVAELFSSFDNVLSFVVT